MLGTELTLFPTLIWCGPPSHLLHNRRIPALKNGPIESYPMPAVLCYITCQMFLQWKAQKASEIFSSRWHFHQLQSQLFLGGKRGIHPHLSYAWKCPPFPESHIHPTTVINPPSILITPGKRSDSSICLMFVSPGPSHATSLPYEPYTTAIYIFSASIFTADKHTQVVNDMS